jgi:hypothetical protein
MAFQLLRLAAFAEQYSGIAEFNGSNTDIQNSHALQNLT